jgi:hypothetical protein
MQRTDGSIVPRRSDCEVIFPRFSLVARARRLMLGEKSPRMGTSVAILRARPLRQLAANSRRRERLLAVRSRLLDPERSRSIMRISTNQETNTFDIK